ncbi:uncharacterized protein LOC129612151 [Condylostylus longicornis]|uniref:uncharacterized protein LOC129612151 n=1 Tax=Condylostylus longicornis TaxID=2530218 RepID=UPI00244E3094|nr:uncharacterized protein LOC129612151 [Condylostylus longicornis]
MSDTDEIKNVKDPEKESSDLSPAKSKKQKHRKDKPWDTPDIDKWKIDKFSPDDNPSGLLEESSFATLFPQYREKYLRDVWPDVKRALSQFHIKAELDLVEGSMTVRTTKKTWDPFSIIKARDLIKLLSRSVPLPQAVKILQDDTYCDIIKIGGFVRNKDRFVRRRQRLAGPNGSTLKAIELLTNCYVLIQGQTVCCMGSVKGLKAVRTIVEDCMKNVHPVYHIKELMIKKELEKDEILKDENWDRFLPHFKKRNTQRKKRKIEKKKGKQLFPPDPTPRKEDLLMESGEYFITEEERKRKQQEEKRKAMQQKAAEKKRKREAEYEEPQTVGKKRKFAQEETIEALAERVKQRAPQARGAKKEAAATRFLF